jgi:hypothetical protein
MAAGDKGVGLPGLADTFATEHTSAQEVIRCTDRRGCLLPLPPNGITRARPGFRRSDHHLNRFADKPIEITVSIQLSGYLGRNPG